MTKKWLAIGLVSLLLLAPVASSPASAAPPTELTRVSTAATGGDPNASSISPSISHDGNFVVFASYATNLVVDPVAAQPQAYGAPSTGGPVELISVNNAGEIADDGAQSVSTAGDGRFVVFSSRARNLGAYDGLARTQIFLRDRLLGTTELVSVNTSGVAGNSHSDLPSVSGDGRFVAFWSTSTNLGGSPYWRVYLHDRGNGTTIPIPVFAPVGARVYTYNALVSDDGSAVAFRSESFSEQGYSLGPIQALVYHTSSGETSGVSVAPDGTPGNGTSVPSDISGDGRFIVFHSRAVNLAPMAGYGPEQVFVRDTVLGTTELVSVENRNRGVGSAFASVSDDGQTVTYSTAPGTGRQQIVQRDRGAGSAIVVAETDIPWGSLPVAYQDASGQHIAFETNFDLGGSDHNGARDIYVLSARDRIAPQVSGAADHAPNAAGWSPIGTTVTWTAVDPEPSSGAASVPDPTVVETEGRDQVITSGQSCDAAGNCAVGSVLISVDATAPTLIPSTLQIPSAGGWFNEDVVYQWACSDSLSGIDGVCPADSVISGEGAGLAASAVVSDLAGNSAITSTPDVRIDRTPPVTQVLVHSEWYRQDIEVALSSSDNLSGVSVTHFSLDGGPTLIGDAVAITGQGLHTLTYTSTDNAGNSEAPQTATFRVDAGSPEIEIQVSPAPNSAGWNNSAVTVTTVCTDVLSGIASCSEPVVVAADGANQQVVVAGVDFAGNTSTRVVSVSIDTRAPTVGVDAVSNGGQYPLGSNPTPNCTTSDDTSGVGVAATLRIERLSNGTHIVTCSGAVDAAGNAAAAVSVLYRVIPNAASLQSLTLSLIEGSGAPHPAITKGVLAILSKANGCAYVAQVRLLERAGSLSTANATELIYWANILNPTCTANGL